jgi:hypothetical protein
VCEDYTDFVLDRGLAVSDEQVHKLYSPPGASKNQRRALSPGNLNGRPAAS